MNINKYDKIRNVGISILFIYFLIRILEVYIYITDKTEYPWGTEMGGFVYKSKINYLIFSFLEILFFLVLLFSLIRRKYLFFFIAFILQIIISIVI